MFKALFNIMRGGWYCDRCGKYHSKKTHKYLQRTPDVSNKGGLTYTITYNCGGKI